MKTRYFTLIVLLTLLGLTDCKKDEEEKVIETPRAPTGTFTDPRDEQVYNTIDIGTQVWFAENLNYETSNSHWYDNDPVNGDIYGRLYSGHAALNVCPTGWHLPSDDEWKTLEMYLGMSQSEADTEGDRGFGAKVGKKLKSTSLWNYNGNGTNSSGFSGLPGGEVGFYGAPIFYNLGGNGYWYTSTKYSSEFSWFRQLQYTNDNIGRKKMHYIRQYSIRCVKDSL